MTTKTYSNTSVAPDGSSYVTLTDGAGNLVTAGASGITIGTTAITGGATTQVLFNLAGVVSSDSGLTYAGSGGTLTVPNAITNAAASNFVITGTNGIQLQAAAASPIRYNTDLHFFQSQAGVFAVGLKSSGTNNICYWVDNSSSAFAGRMGFGGSTSAFPALARSGTTLQVKLADGSADTGITCSTISASSGPLQFVSSGNFSANTTVATVLGSVGPAGANTTVQEWLTIKNAGGTTRYIPCF
jgi:hypothetical protein